MKKLASIVLFVNALFLSGCGSMEYISAETASKEVQFKSRTIDEYKLGVDDTIQVNVWKNPELSVSVPVRPDGKISIPLIGDVHAAGYKPEEIAESIRKKLQNYVRDPNVTIMVTGLRSHEYLTRVRVTGAVNNQMSLNFRQGMTVIDAVLEAGGVNDFASPNNTKLYRRVGNSPITQVVDIYLGDILYDGKLLTNIELLPRDVITVPERLF